MALRFGNYCLRDERGKIFIVPPKRLLEECLNSSFDDLSISNIIFSSIEKATGERIVRSKGYNSSILYQWLEKKVWGDSRYQQHKKLKEEKWVKRREASKEAKSYAMEELYYLMNRKN